MRIVIIFCVLFLLGCASKKSLYSSYSASNRRCIPNLTIELRGDSTYEMNREFKEANRFYSYGKWSLIGDSLTTENSIQSPNQLVNLSYSTDAGLPDSVMMVRIVESNNSPLSGYLTTKQFRTDTIYRDTDYFFGQKLIPASTTQIHILLLFVTSQQLTYTVSIVNGNVITLKASTVEPKFYDIYESRKFLIVSRKRKLVPIPNIGDKCILSIGRGAKRIK